MSRLPVRLRLTAAFAVAMVLVLAGAGLFVYLRLKSDLNESVNAGLNSRATAVLAASSASAGAAGDAEEGFAQLVRGDGSVLDSAGNVRGEAISRAELRRAAAGEKPLVERKVAGIEGTTRVLAKAGGGSQVVTVGQSLDDRDETLDNLVASFALGGPIAVVFASVLGYALAAAGLRPVEAMRRRAQEVSLSREDERLPLPVAHDEIRRLGETLNQMLDRLRRSFARERRFVADASHELRTPVAVIKAELEGALRAGGHHPQVREALVASMEECDHLAQLAEDLLVLARTSEGALPVRPEKLDIRELLDRVAARFADRAGERDRSIRVDGGDGRTLYADELRLRQALGNLVDNALRYGDGQIVLRARARGHGVEVEVSDSGNGFAPDFAERAFERFARGDLARSRDGAGLGLSIVRAIAEAHGGRAEVVPGDGAAVRIWLPDRPERVSGSSQIAGVACLSQEINPVRGGETR
ncbi:MAG: HAMP domain-containing protein [Solirubrobacterales bacterium]|nr:HAMP domain-containing protein [Solirubrobacterales bacterium]